MLASWDGEEYGMVGSTEYVEDKKAFLNQSVVAYLNVDNTAYGPAFSASATPSLSQMIRDVTRLVRDPKTGLSVHDAWFEWQRKQWPELTRPMAYAMGSGSDFVGFVDHVGIPSLGFNFNGPYGVYHSNYDSFYWMSHFGDPGFHYVCIN